MVENQNYSLHETGRCSTRTSRLQQPTFGSQDTAPSRRWNLTLDNVAGGLRTSGGAATTRSGRGNPRLGAAPSTFQSSFASARSTTPAAFASDAASGRSGCSQGHNAAEELGNGARHPSDVSWVSMFYRRPNGRRDREEDGFTPHPQLRRAVQLDVNGRACYEGGVDSDLASQALPTRPVLDDGVLKARERLRKQRIKAAVAESGHSRPLDYHVVYSREHDDLCVSERIVALGWPRAVRKAEDGLVPLKHAEDGSLPLERLVEPLCSTMHGHARHPFPLVSSFWLASAPLFQMGRSALRSSWTPRRSPAPSVIDLVQFEHRHRASGAERRRRQREDVTLTLESNDEPGPTPSSADGEIIGPAGQPTLPLVEPAPGSGVGPAPQPEPSLLGPIVTAPAPGPEPVVQQPVVPTMPVTESVLPPSMLTTDTAPQSPAPKTAPAPVTATPPQSRTPLCRRCVASPLRSPAACRGKWVWRDWASGN